MGTISRGTKSGTGTTDFGTGTTILAAEMNTDLNAVFNVVNGNLDDDNLANDAVTTAKITDLNVTTGKLAANAVTTAKITDLNVTTGKLAVGATVADSDSGTPSTSLNITTGDTTVVTLGSVTTRGGPVLLGGMIGWYLNIQSGSAGLADQGDVTIRIKRDGSTIKTYIYAVANTAVFAGDVQFPLPTILYVDTPAAGSYVYTITAEPSFSGHRIRTLGAGTGSVFAIALA